MNKIIFVAPQFKNGGGNRVFVELANSISRINNYELEIIYPNNSREINHYKIESKVHIKAIGKIAEKLIPKLFNSFLLFRYVIKELKINESTTVIISDPILSVFLYVIPRKYNKNIIRFIQADDYRIYDDLFVLRNKLFLFVFKLLTRLNYKLKLKYIFNSNFTYDRFISISNRKDVAKLIVHPAVDKDIFNYSKSRNDLLNDKISICLIARDHPLKKLEDFIRAWSVLSPHIKNKISKVHLISTDKLEKFDLNEFTLVRPKDDYEIAEVFRKTDIFISTSLWEGFSLPPLEALNCGATILSSDSGGVREYARNDYNASLYSPGNISELKEKLTELINDKNKRDMYNKYANETIKEFSWDKSAKMLISIIENKI
ncbi:glycosyltransferase family 4 protein [Flavobacterium sp. W22_SRS_FK3]|uniref:glycosyltransferase family 4 protein n=1 Tax=Flavobacterium sp. W22_SRS_FK3 TaxID=3240275 RepID=UPI003F902D3F